MDSISLWELCEHDETVEHPVGGAHGDWVDTMSDEWCPGGRDRTFLHRQRYWHEGTGENGDTSTWFVPVQEHENVWIEVKHD